jgi:hypothetical protein
MKRLFSVLALFTLFAAISMGATINFFTTLSGANENPPNSSLGIGAALVTYDSILHTLAVRAVFGGLTGTTTVAHIHCCVDPTGNAGVATFPGTFPGFPAGVTSGTYDNTMAPLTPIDLTSAASYTAGFLSTFGGGTAAGAETALIAGMLAGQSYFNIHSTFRPGGEIRGTLQQIVPEPATFSLAGGVLLFAAVYQVRRKRA